MLLEVLEKSLNFTDTGLYEPCAQLFLSAPLALMSHNVGSGKSITSHPSVKEQLVKGKCSLSLYCLYTGR